MEKFVFDVFEYENRGKCTGKRFQYITLATKNTRKSPRGHYFLPYGSLLGQFFQRIGSLFGSL